MKNRLSALLVGSLLLIVGAGCAPAPAAVTPPSSVVGAPAPGTSPEPVTAPTPTVVTVSEQDKGTTVQVKEGSTIDLVLHSTYWTIQRPDSKILQPLAAEATVTPNLKGGVPGSGAGTVEMKYTVNGKGAAQLVASRTTCGEAMRCTGDDGAFQVTIVAEGSAAAPGTKKVTAPVVISGSAFGPADVTVKAGTVVVWDNQDAMTHTVTADDNSFDSGSIPTGQTFSRTFDKIGVFAYHCAIHPSMKGTITVTQ